MTDLNKPQFHILIVGAGISGLSAAVGLRRKGHQVTVLERFHELKSIGGSILVSPNALRIIGNYGLYEEFEKAGCIPEDHTTHRYETGEVLDCISFESTKSTFGYHMLGMQRNSIQRLLFDAAEHLGVNIRLSCEIESIDENAPSITLRSGEKIQGDMIVGADGIKSRVRSVVIGKEIEPITESTAFQTIVRGDIVRSNPLTLDFMNKADVHSWFGPGFNLVGGADNVNDVFLTAFTVMNATEKNTALLPTKDSIDNSLTKGYKDAMLSYAQNLEPRIKSYFGLVAPENVTLWRFAYLPDLDTWVSTSGKVVLIGDAAHAMVPHVAQGAATAIEDGGCLAECIGSARSVEDIPIALQAYQKIRKPRVEKIKAMALATGQFKCLPDGPEQRARDQKMREAMDPKISKFELLKAAGGMDWVFRYDFVEACTEELGQVFGHTSVIRSIA